MKNFEIFQNLFLVKGFNLSFKIDVFFQGINEVVYCLFVCVNVVVYWENVQKLGRSRFVLLVCVRVCDLFLK